jgi:hypothetical protein
MYVELNKEQYAKMDRVVSGSKANDHNAPQPLNQTCVESM